MQRAVAYVANYYSSLLVARGFFTAKVWLQSVQK